MRRRCITAPVALASAPQRQTLELKVADESRIKEQHKRKCKKKNEEAENEEDEEEKELGKVEGCHGVKAEDEQKKMGEEEEDIGEDEDVDEEENVEEDQEEEKGGEQIILPSANMMEDSEKRDKEKHLTAAQGVDHKGEEKEEDEEMMDKDEETEDEDGVKEGEIKDEDYDVREREN